MTGSWPRCLFSHVTSCYVLLWVSDWPIATLLPVCDRVALHLLLGRELFGSTCVGSGPAKLRRVVILLVVQVGLSSDAYVCCCSNCVFSSEPGFLLSLLMHERALLPPESSIDHMLWEPSSKPRSRVLTRLLSSPDLPTGETLLIAGSRDCSRVIKKNEKR